VRTKRKGFYLGKLKRIDHLEDEFNLANIPKVKYQFFSGIGVWFPYLVNISKGQHSN
jgi:hypothetical protein